MSNLPKKTRGKTPRVSNRLIEKAVFAHNGNLSAAARYLGYERSNLVKRLGASRIAEIRDDVEQQMLDAAENVVAGEIEEGNFQAARYFLDRKGAERGYGRIDINMKHSGDADDPIEVNKTLKIEFVDAPDTTE